MMTDILSLATGGAVLASGLVAGVFMSFSDFVMRGLGKAGAPAGVAAMQQINREIYRSLFMVLLIGMSAVSLALALLGTLTGNAAFAAWLWFAAALYLSGVMAVTGRRNVPMNKRLDGEEAGSVTARYTWATYLRDWTRWNHLRWLAALAAAACYLAASHAA